MRSHKEIAEEILGYPIREDGCAPCPGAALHTAQSGPRDWRIWFDNIICGGFYAGINAIQEGDITDSFFWKIPLHIMPRHNIVSPQA